MIINFLGHGFQWWQNNIDVPDPDPNHFNPNPDPFAVPENCEIRFYIQQAGDLDAFGQIVNGDYDGRNTPPIINHELNRNWEDIVAAYHPEERCPEHFLIGDIGNWRDITQQVQGLRRLDYMGGVINIVVNGDVRLRIREFGYQGELPRFPNNRQFACSPSESIFSLSWLANHMREMLIAQGEIFGLNIVEDEPMVLRWLVCREPVVANDINGIPAALGREDEILIR